jgi:hypothetical protein
MSHIVTIATEIRDAEALCLGCDRLGLTRPVHRTAKLFSSEATGYCVNLPEWRYPVVCDVESGSIHYDNFNGRWGEQSRLDALLQMYAVEKTRLEARRRGHTVTEQAMADGAIKLTVQVGGAA